MASKIVKIGPDARGPMIEGVNILADAVGATMGPGGRLAALCRDFGPVMMTKDGVTVAREIDLQDRYQDAGARLCKQVASRCSDQVGDGTSTATVLSRSMINQGVKHLSSGVNPVHLKRGIDRAVKVVVEHIKDSKKPLSLENESLLRDVARISGNDEEVGQFVSEAFLKAGEHGIVTFEEGRTSDTRLETVDGTQFDRGYISPYFVTDPAKDQCVLENPAILLWERKITTFQEIVPLLQKVAASQKPLLIISDGVDGDALPTILVNIAKGVLFACAVTSPAFGEQRKYLMQDLAVLTGGKFFDESGGQKLENVNLEDLGTARRVIVNKASTTIIEGKGSNSPELEARLESLRTQLKESDSKYDQDKLQQRIAKLGGGVVVIKMGAHNEIEMREKKFRYEDAVFATRAALEEGIVPGGGSILLSAIPLLEKLDTSSEGEGLGVKIVIQALKTPCQLIAENAGFTGAAVLEKVMATQAEKKDPCWGFNADTGQYEDLFKAGVIDPAKVGRLAVENSATIAGLFLLTEALIVDDPDEKKQPGMDMRGMM